MGNNVVMGVVEALASQGFAVLRFNFRGVGGSGGTYDAGTGETEDVRAALRFLAAVPGVDRTRLCLAGYSFGAGVALRAASVPAPRSANKGERASPEDAERVVGAALIGCPPRAVEQALGAAPEMPRLFVAGEWDVNASPPLLRPLMPRFHPPAELLSIPGADHFFVGHEPIVGGHVVRFFQRVLSTDH
jgi:alpha/beta superfamily hydrolase